MSLRRSFQRAIGDDLALFGFEMLPRKVACERRFDPQIEQRVWLTKSRDSAGEQILTPFVSTRVDALHGSPGDYGAVLDWTFTLQALIANPQVACELRVPREAADDLLHAWLGSIGRELQQGGLAFFDRTRTLDQLVEFATSAFCRERSASYSEVHAWLQRAGLHKLAGQADAFERDVARAAAACPSRSQADLAGFVSWLREAAVDA